MEKVRPWCGQPSVKLFAYCYTRLYLLSILMSVSESHIFGTTLPQFKLHWIFCACYLRPWLGRPLTALLDVAILPVLWMTSFLRIIVGNRRREKRAYSKSLTRGQPRTRGGVCCPQLPCEDERDTVGAVCVVSCSRARSTSATAVAPTCTTSSTRRTASTRDRRTAGSTASTTSTTSDRYGYCSPSLHVPD